MGIAHEADNIYWAFNGELGALDRYDFHEPHVVGGDDHSDGELWRYAEGQLSRVPGVPSHLALDIQMRTLYVADTGHQRIVRLELDSGTPGNNVPTLDPIAVHRSIDGATVDEIVGPGVLQAPAGLTLAGDGLLVADDATGILSWFTLDGALLDQVATELPHLAGVAVGPDGKPYVTDLDSGGAYRVEVP
jgi:sugar lactone lactonase YvrE